MRFHDFGKMVNFFLPEVHDISFKVPIVSVEGNVLLFNHHIVFATFNENGQYIESFDIYQVTRSQINKRGLFILDVFGQNLLPDFR